MVFVGTSGDRCGDGGDCDDGFFWNAAGVGVCGVNTCGCSVLDPFYGSGGLVVFVGSQPCN